MNMPNFSILTIILLLLGWLSHWLMSVRKARITAKAVGTDEPSLLQYWYKDWPTTWLSVIGLVVFYFVVPELSVRWSDLAILIGATEKDPMNPLAAYLGGIFSPWFADVAGKRLSKMVGDES